MRRSPDVPSPAARTLAISPSFALAALLGLGAIAGLALLTRAFGASPPGGGTLPPEAWPWGLLAAGLTTSVSTVGAAWAVCRVGSAAVGALAEKPELFGRLLIFLGLAEGLAIYGLIVSILLIDRLV